MKQQFCFYHNQLLIDHNSLQSVYLFQISNESKAIQQKSYFPVGSNLIKSEWEILANFG